MVLWEANAAARAQWLQTEIVDYDFRYISETPDGRAVLQIEVRDGDITNRIATEASSNKNAFTMIDLFHGIEEILAQQVSTPTVDHDPEYGFPTNVQAVIDNGGEPAQAFFNVDQFRQPSDYPEQCSTAGIELRQNQVGGLPLAVLETREALLEAAAECDFLALAAIASDGDGFVETSFGGSGVELIWNAEAAGDPLLTTMVDLFSGSAVLADRRVVWPAEFVEYEGEDFGWRI